MADKIDRDSLLRCLKLIDQLRENQQRAAKKLDELEICIQLFLLWPEVVENRKSKARYAIVDTGRYYGKNPFELVLRVEDETRVIPFDEIPDIFLNESLRCMRETRRKRRAEATAGQAEVRDSAAQ